MYHINPKRIEMRNIFYHGIMIGLAMLGLSFFSPYIAGACVYVISLFTGEGFNESYYIMLNATSLSYAVNVFITLIVFIVPFFLAALFLKYKVTDIIQFNKPISKKIAIICIVFSLGFCMIGNIVTNGFAQVLEVFLKIKPTQPIIPQEKGLFYILISIVGGAAMPALVEEFAFRGVVLGALRKFGDWPAIIISSVLFAIMHGNFVQIPFALCVGIALGAATVICNSIWPAIIAHFINNSFSVISQYVPDFIFVLLFYVVLILGVVAFAVLVNTGKFKSLRDVPSCTTASKRTLIIFASPTIIISTLVFLFEASLNIVKV